MTISSEAPADFPRAGRLLGLDFGTKRLGIAISTPEQTIASPLEGYNRHSPEHDGRHLLALVQQYNVVGLVVGLPVHMSGDEGAKAREAREFGVRIGKTTGLPVRYWDERFSSLRADQLLQQQSDLSGATSRRGDLRKRKPGGGRTGRAKLFSKSQRKARRDKVAAQVILQSFLDTDDRNRQPTAL